jgi:hypothetical protein
MEEISLINNHVRNICKIGQGNACCRYLVISGVGFECVKGTEMKAYLDSRVAMETMVARADNCEGQTIEFLNGPNIKSE